MNLLNGRQFRSLQHLNESARWWLAEVADKRIHGTTKKTPLELHAEELPHLLALPSLQFDTAQVVYRIVDTDGTIQIANNRYSVPWQLVAELLPVRILEAELVVYNQPKCRAGYRASHQECGLANDSHTGVVQLGI